MTTEQTPEQKAAESRAEKITFGIFAAIIVALVFGWAALGLVGVGLVALATVPVIYVLLIMMAGGKG
ncbi:hypothetical protein [Aliiroseovarius sediminis]|uniref:hypothetical protein n=1 Tax=Aliiroseovarius sediminis TaxID=2925839 RepID=UPI001F584D84|nr:hypothetical protein [Aliiroseovarius sediminis]MCI2394200.1 hypothetical protein [Aliiroseovarius sediminis]